MKIILVIYSSLCVVSACSAPQSQRSNVRGMDTVGMNRVTHTMNESFERLRDLAKDKSYKLEEFDLNRDKKPDIFKFYKTQKQSGGTVIANLMVRQDIDINYDSMIDLTRIYSKENEISEERSDLDFDGRIDSISYFEEGTLVRKEHDLNFDGVSDVVMHYAKGELSSIETDNKRDGKIDTWEYYEEGTLDRIGRDNDGDGTVDVWERLRTPVDPEEEAQDSENSVTSSEESPEAEKSNTKIQN